MKLLIVDDNTAKISQVVTTLLGIPSIERDNIDVAQCAHDAREKLSKNQYDLLILDLCLPHYAESDPNLESSLSLLFEIYANDSLHKPKRIVGLSMYDEVISDAKAQFDEYLWTILHYSLESDSWKNSIVNAVTYLLGEPTPLNFHERVDLCILTALYKPELEAILDLDWNWESPTPLDDTTFVHKGKFYSEGTEYSVVVASAHRMGMVASSLLSSKLITKYKPRFLVMAGICAGVREKTNYGDAILANPTWDYQCGKRTEDETGPYLFIAPHQISVLEFIEAHFLILSRNSEVITSIKKAWRGEKPEAELKLICGPVASGSAVLADQNSVDEVKKQLRTLVGIEMEIYGVYAAGSNASSPQPITFAIKSVCDHADLVKNDIYQKYAAYTSATVIKVFLEMNMNHFYKNILK